MSQVGNQHTTNPPLCGTADPIAALRAALERHFAEMGLTVDFDAPLPATTATDAETGTVVARAA
ncbi:MAG: hypothetical protein PGN25_05670 [Methylorubrum populi]